MGGGIASIMVFDSRWIRFNAWGHHNVRATHRSTLEITRDEDLTPRGDCIIGVKSTLSTLSLPDWFKEYARRDDSIIVLVLCSGGYCDSIVGRGSRGLLLSDPTRIIVRRSSFIEPATLMINASKSAVDLDRRLVSSLRTGSMLEAYLTVIQGSLHQQGHHNISLMG